MVIKSTKPKTLYHGSNKRINLLLPKRPIKDLPNNSMKAVFATSNKRLALSMGLTGGKTSSFRGYKKLNFVKGKPNIRAVYLHYLNPKYFIKNRKEEFISRIQVKPYKIEHYPLYKLSNLWRLSNKKELKEFLKDRDKWRKKNKDK
jgi:hypothetical protein